MLVSLYTLLALSASLDGLILKVEEKVGLEVISSSFLFKVLSDEFPELGLRVGAPHQLDDSDEILHLRKPNRALLPLLLQNVVN